MCAYWLSFLDRHGSQERNWLFESDRSALNQIFSKLLYGGFLCSPGCIVTHFFLQGSEGSFERAIILGLGKIPERGVLKLGGIDNFALFQGLNLLTRGQRRITPDDTIRNLPTKSITPDFDNLGEPERHNGLFRIGADSRIDALWYFHRVKFLADMASERQDLRALAQIIAKVADRDVRSR